MYIITLIVALFQMRGSALTGNAWIDAFLDQMVAVEGWFFGASWLIWILVIGVVALIAYLFWSGKISIDWNDYSCIIAAGLIFVAGSVVIAALLWPLWEGISFFLIQGMATSFDPVLGITNMGAFVICFLAYLWLGQA